MMASSVGKAIQEQPAQLQAPREVPPVNFYPPAKDTATAGVGGPRLPPSNGVLKNTSKPPLPPNAKAKRPRSDSDLSDVSEGSGGSDFDAGNEAESDYASDDSSERKGKRESNSRKRRRTPEDNEMRRKLRGNTPQADPGSRQPSADAEQHASETDAISDFEDEDDPTAVPEREVGPEEEHALKEGLKTSWELITILDFLSIFQPYLNLDHLQFSADELASSLVLNNGTTGLLSDLHIGLLKGISTRSNLHSGNWTASLAEKLKVYWRVCGLPGNPPFASQRRREAATYAVLSLPNRVTALRILCELRLDKDDLHNVVEYALHPPKKTKAERKAIAAAAAAGKPLPKGPPMPTMDQMRRQPLAKDSSGLLYWYLDYHSTTGTRMYKETPDSLLKAKTKKEQSEPQWELIASSPEELTEVGEKLRRSKKKPDQTLASLILDEIVPELLERRESDLKKQRAAARVRSQLNNILPDESGGYGGRSRRTRKEVNYSFDAYDAQIRAALKVGGRNQDEPESRLTRSSAFLEPRMTAEEEAQLGLRRGRSAHAPETDLELPPNRRARPASNAASAEPTPLQTAEPTPVPSSREPTPPPSSVTGEGDEEPSGKEWRSTEGQESAEVEISELGSKENYQGGSLEAEDEEISSVSQGGSEGLGFTDDPTDMDWR